MSEWDDMIVGDRMAVDQEFTDRVQDSQFSNQEWGLIMTATKLEIEHPEDPEAARIVATTDSLESILPELASIRTDPGPMGGPPQETGNGDGRGLIDSLKSALGLGGDTGGVDQAQLAAAESLTQEYADELQAHLESKDAFEAARKAYVESNES